MKIYNRYTDKLIGEFDALNLSGANLQGANLYGADLRNANLQNADLRGANLYVANLRGADLYVVDLQNANLYVANLRGADLYGADLRGADLYGADLRGANLRGAKGLKERQICPKGKSFRAWKKIISTTTGFSNIICELEIPRGAKKVNHPGSRKCRSNIAKVISMTEGATVGRSIHNASFIYRLGETLRVSDFSADIREECAPGIHFFLTKEEAERY